MELDEIYALARKVKAAIHCSQQMAEYIASLLGLEHTLSADSFQLRAEIHAIHALQGGD